MALEALIFDCDGVIVDTEKDGHRVAFNMAFAKKGMPVEWSVEEYKELLKVAGGKERMTHYFNMHTGFSQFSVKDGLVKELHKQKTEYFMQLIQSGALPLRPGVLRIIDQAIAKRLKLAVCSTSNEKSVQMIVEKLLGEKRKKHFQAILAGDIVSKKKPDPEIYELCKKMLSIDPVNCVVVEDSRNGLLAAKAAGFNCLITTNDYTMDEDFSEADKVVDELGDGKNIKIEFSDLEKLVDNVIKQ